MATSAMGAVFAAFVDFVGAVEVMIGMMAIPAMQRYHSKNGPIFGNICAEGPLGAMIPPPAIAMI